MAVRSSPARVVSGLFLLVIAAAAPSSAQDTLPPALGGRVPSLGLPAQFKPYYGAAAGLESRDGDTHLASQLRLGVFRDVGSPVNELLGWSVEYRLGLEDTHLDQGVRALLTTHALGLAVGGELGLRRGDARFVVAVLPPIRRGGPVGAGSELRVEWTHGHGDALAVAVNVPIGQPNLGHTRPHATRVSLGEPPEPAVSLPPPDTALGVILARMARQASWVARFVAPPLGGFSTNLPSEVGAAVRPLRDRLADGAPDLPGPHGVADEFAAWHRAVREAFALTVGALPPPPGTTTPLGDTVAARARAILLERVLLPWNGLLGQAKDGSTREFAQHARGAFARWLMMRSSVPPALHDATLQVFDALLADVEAVRREAQRTWDDSRLVWLPLQLALEPGEYGSQEELDSLVSHAVGRSFQKGNRLRYVHNDRFLTDLIASIGEAREYHVLWIHDVRGRTPAGRPDRLSLLVATHAYLTALRDRVREYDATGRLPLYIVLLDQHYFEQNRSRELLRFLQDPLRRRLDLPDGSDSLAGAMRHAQEELRAAVADSRLLAAERARYGEAWLHDQVKVHVNITFPADPSFRSAQILPLIGVPDDIMRDHRKVALWDVSEEDPYRGMAMYAGMGVGEHYAGPGWEDRAVMLQGPAALKCRDQVRVLLAAQGMRPWEIPHVLRPRPRAPDYDTRVQAEIDSTDRIGLAATRALDLHNAPGFALKEASVAEAVVFSLTAPGGVVKVPDSIWINQLLASLLTGASLRGTRVLLIAPAQSTASAGNWINLVLIHDLFTRLLVARDSLAPVLAASGGVLAPGIYEADIGVDDLQERLRRLARRLRQEPMLRDLYAFAPATTTLLDSAEQQVGPLPARAGAPLPSEQAGNGRPRLHFKGYLYVSAEAWRFIVSGVPMTAGFREYLTQRARQVREGPAVDEGVMAEAMQRVGAMTINPLIDSLARLVPDCHLSAVDCATHRWVFYLAIGSANQDYRSMLMDGEAMLLVSKWTALYALPDFVMLTGLTAWPRTPADLDRYLPPPADFRRWFAWGVRKAF